MPYILTDWIRLALHRVCSPGAGASTAAWSAGVT
jgi:hypothetical protein